MQFGYYSIEIADYSAKQLKVLLSFREDDVKRMGV
jgi:hypothetical protein